MSNEKFTPGEWTAHLGIMEPTFVFVGREEDYDDEKTPIICELHFGIKKKYLGSRCLNMDDREKQANAHLIAAVPVMYRNNEQTLTELEQMIPAMLAVCADCHNRNCKVCQFAKVLKTASEMERRIEQVQKKARGEQ